MKVNTVSIIGVTGTMGANVAGIFASFGNAKVYCIGRDIEKVKKTIPRIIRSVRADAIAHNLIPADFSQLEACVEDSDFVFESCSENIEIKKSIAKRVDCVLGHDAVTCTGTSGLSIEDIATCYSEDNRRRFFGVHMFNPPYVMSLCELVSIRESSPSLKEELRFYLERNLYRTVVEVKDSPAFLGNRIGFQLINEALQHADRYKDNGGIDYIDAIMGPFTGRVMPPLVTSDFVGLDVHKAIVDNIFFNTNDYSHESFRFPEFAERLVEEGKLGRKAGGGLYRVERYENGYRREMVLDITTGTYRDVIPYVFPFAEMMKVKISEGDYSDALALLINNRSLEAEICLGFLLKYIVYALWTANEVGYSTRAADDVMATGFNWCPPLAMCLAIENVTGFCALVDERVPFLAQSVDLERLISSCPQNKYDYRPFFRSGR